MYSFRNDYSDGVHPEILKALSETNNIQADGYGEDTFSLRAAELLKTRMGTNDVDIHFISGGTLTNLVAISAFLRPHEAVISAATGHIYVHETGAIEATGHKVLPVNTADGKLGPEMIREAVTEHHFEHMVKPGLVYISQPTEIGTLYSKAELSALRMVCDELNLILYADGARLGSALTSHSNDLKLGNYTELCDAFYIGGTKNGALAGEALVICNNNLKQDFRYHMKQKGALAAKGRVLGIQFLALFEDNLYLRLAVAANAAAMKLQSGIEALGYKMKFVSATNQIFPVLPEDIITELEKEFLFYRWEKEVNGSSAIRLVCSWSTDQAQVDNFISLLKKASGV